MPSLIEQNEPIFLIFGSHFRPNYLSTPNDTLIGNKFVHFRRQSYLFSIGGMIANYLARLSNFKRKKIPIIHRPKVEQIYLCQKTKKFQ